LSRPSARPLLSAAGVEFCRIAANPPRPGNVFDGTYCSKSIPSHLASRSPSSPELDDSSGLLEPLLPQPCALSFSCRQVQYDIVSREHHAVDFPGFINRNDAVFNVVQYSLGLAFQRIAIAAAA